MRDMRRKLVYVPVREHAPRVDRSVIGRWHIGAAHGAHARSELCPAMRGPAHTFTHTLTQHIHTAAPRLSCTPAIRARPAPRGSAHAAAPSGDEGVGAGDGSGEERGGAAEEARGFVPGMHALRTYTK